MLASALALVAGCLAGWFAGRTRFACYTGVHGTITVEHPGNLHRCSICGQIRPKKASHG